MATDAARQGLTVAACALLAVAALAPGAPARAQDVRASDVEAEGDVPGLDEEARSLFNAGKLAFANGRYENALEYFEQAYELTGRPLLLYNVASAADRLRRDARALEAYEAYLEVMPEGPNHTVVQARIRILRRTADEAERTPEDDAGEPDRAAGGSAGAPDARGDADDGGPAQRGTTAGGDADTSPTTGGPRLGLLITGSVLAVGGLGAGIYWIERAYALKDCEDATNASVACLNDDSIRTQRNTAMGLSLGLLAAGATGMILGLVLRTEPDDPGAARVSCMPAGAGVSCRGAF